jgi:hypothetical protein
MENASPRPLPAAGARRSPVAADVANQLERLSALLQQGALTPAEFAQAKQRLLSEPAPAAPPAPDPAPAPQSVPARGHVGLALRVLLAIAVAAFGGYQAYRNFVPSLGAIDAARQIVKGQEHVEPYSAKVLWSDGNRYVVFVHMPAGYDLLVPFRLGGNGKYTYGGHSDFTVLPCNDPPNAQIEGMAKTLAGSLPDPDLE